MTDRMKSFDKIIWGKVFKSGPSKICGRQPFKKFEKGIVCLGRPYPFKFFKGCLPQILFGSLLSTLSYLFYNHDQSYQIRVNLLSANK